MRRTILAGLMATMLAACGFQPVYDTAGSGLGPMEIGEIEGRTGYLVRQELLRRAALEKGTGAPRKLDVQVLTRFAGAAREVTGYDTRTQMSVFANYSFGGAAGIRGATSVMVGYDGQGVAFGDVALQADAEERAAIQLADRIWLDLLRKARAKPGAAR